MSQQDLIQFISNHFDSGRNQDDVRQLAQRQNIPDEQYAAALVTVLSHRLKEDHPAPKAIPPVAFVVAAVVLITVGFLLTKLGGEFAAAAGWAAVSIGVGAAVWRLRKPAGA